MHHTDAPQVFDEESRHGKDAIDLLHQPLIGLDRTR